jgi:hypothetical protein
MNPPQIQGLQVFHGHVSLNEPLGAKGPLLVEEVRKDDVGKVGS